MNIKKLNLNFRYKSALEAYLHVKAVGKRLQIVFAVTAIIFCIMSAIEKTKSGSDVQKNSEKTSKTQRK